MLFSKSARGLIQRARQSSWKANAFNSNSLFATHAKQKIQYDGSGKYQPGDIYSGFLCKRVQFIPDFNMTAVCLEHQNTGLQYIHVDRNDSNNLFSINFRTTPFNSSGLPHILEHTVLCGSNSYPVRDPFFKMLNRSLATFMNAMTGPDYTLYPFSSTNEKDYRNLQDIYMDAAFKPNLKYLDFLQEGWRLEHTDLENKSSSYIFKGVVYNEMKGAFSENSAVFGQNLFNKLLPEHTYGFVSGGDPVDIPNLTHQDLVNFHKKYYHPSNSRIFSYGNFELNRNLDYVNGYLDGYNRIDSSYSEVPNQTRWTQPRKAHVTSRFDNMGAPMEKQNQIAIGYLMSDIRDIYETFLMHFLTELLVKGPNSYFYKTLIEPNISGGYGQMTGYDATIKDTMFVVGLQDVDTKDFEKVQQIFDATIEQAIEQGFDKKHIESVIHNLELSMKHQTTKFGLGLLFSLTPLMNHNGDVIKAMSLSEQINQLKENIKANPKYLQEKVQQYFKDNNHRLVLTMSPDEDYELKFFQRETSNLETKVKALSEDDKARVFEEGKSLAKIQKAQEDVNCLPCLKLEDISTPEKYDVTVEKIKNVPIQLCTTNTNGVVYFRGLLDASMISNENKKLLPLVTLILDKFGTKNHDYRDFDKLISSKTAGLNFKVHLTENITDKSLYEIGIQFGSYALKDNSQAMFEIFAELLTTVEFNDLKRFEMLLENYMSALSVGIADSGHLFAMQNANGLVTEAGQIKESMLGIEHLNYMKNLQRTKSSAEILEEVKEITKKLLSHPPVRCSLNISDDDKNESLQNMSDLLKDLPSATSGSSIWNQSKDLQSQCCHNVMNIPVNYCAKSLITVNYVHQDFSPLRVLSRILSSKYLLPVVREQNGAYGAGAKVNIDGLFNFFSYRDPNSRKTLDTFDDSSKWILENMKKIIDEQALFEAKLGILQQLDGPVAPMDVGIENFKHGITQEIFAQSRNNILKTSLKDIERVALKYLSDDTKTTVGKSVIGPVNQHLTKAGEKWFTNEQKE